MRIRKLIFTAGQFFIFLLAAFCIFGAFLGAEKAGIFFNSPPMTFFWVLLAILFIAGTLLVPNIRKKPSLALAHIGPALIIAGSIWGSKAGHNLRLKYFNDTKVFSGYMQIHEGKKDNRVYFSENDFHPLDFYLALEDFSVEFYDPGDLVVLMQDKEQPLQFPAVEGAEYQVRGSVIKILRKFENFRVDIARGGLPYDDPGTGLNYALEAQITEPDGTSSKTFVFKPGMSGHHQPGTMRLVYVRNVKDYISKINIISGDNIAGPYRIEVNKPLRYGGYHFYQSGYDDKKANFTLMKVRSDSGLSFVYAGLIIMTGGIFWQLWFVRIKTFIQTSGERRTADVD